jgi:peroxiredoxin (alkyl hydroperoxide reductase subunit C)
MLTIGDKFPDFNLTAVRPGLDGLRGPPEPTIPGQEGKTEDDSSFCKVSLETDAGKWRIIFFWPKNFTFICPTEVMAFNYTFESFAERETVIYGVSTDSEYAHLYWRMHELDMRNIKFPMISDIDHALSKNLGIHDAELGVAMRATFIVDPTNSIRWINVNDMNVGRNPQEALRVLDALSTNKLCQVEWHKGDEPLNPQNIYDHALSKIDEALAHLSKKID